MSATRIGILLLGLAVILVLGTWGWTAAINAVNSKGDAGPVLVALTVYGIAFAFLLVGIGFPYIVLKFHNDEEPNAIHLSRQFPFIVLGVSQR